MSWTRRHTELRDILASLLPTAKESRNFADEAGLDTLSLDLQGTARDNWHEIIRQAENLIKLDDIIRLARKRFPEHPYLERIQEGEPVHIVSPVEDSEIVWKSQETTETLEKLMGKQSTLLPISFLEVGLKVSESIARIRLKHGELGTGFLVQNNLMVTNAHVFPDMDAARSAIAQFHYQQTAGGLDLSPTGLTFNPDDFFLSSPVGDGDWAVVRMKGEANKDWGIIELRDIEVKKGDYVNIIQHPGGGPKQIALYHNVVTHADEKVVQYLTDTLPGSSGSPVFDSDWNIVALHRRGGWITEPGIIKTPVYRNEGTNIRQVFEALKKEGQI